MGLRFVPFPDLSSSGVWRARSLQLVAFPVSAAQFSGCTAGTPCEADADCPEPPEVLAKKPACSLVGKVSPGLRLPLSSPYSSGCLSPVGDGLQLAISVPSFVLCMVLTVSYVRAFRVVAIPQSVWLFSKTMACFSGCLMSSASLQKLFCGVCSALKCSFEQFVREKVVFPSYSSTILGPPPSPQGS